ncbi:MAG: hypothetical protein EXS05_01435 [Planctomycetaceae bacterium]|nr:hypothetical protein [Planctomycetaceae bacterium]
MGLPGAPPAAGKPDTDKAKSVFLVSYPKIVFLYPTFLAALTAGIYMAVAADRADPVKDHDTYVLSTIFLLIVALNLVVFSFDFPRTTSLTLFFCIAAIVLGLLLVFRLNDQILPRISQLLAAFEPWANSKFYFAVAGILGLVYLAVFINVQFDYWEVTPNELLHHHGVLSNLERYASPNLKIDKEITDVFEYALLRSGRLILHPSSEPRAIVLENVMGINSKQDRLTRMLGALQVQVRQAAPGE